MQQLKQLSSLEEKLINIEIPQNKYNNLTREEQSALYNLKNDKNIVIKSADKGCAVVVWDRDDYIKEADDYTKPNLNNEYETRIYIHTKSKILNTSNKMSFFLISIALSITAEPIPSTIHTMCKSK